MVKFANYVSIVSILSILRWVHCLETGEAPAVEDLFMAVMLSTRAIVES